MLAPDITAACRYGLDARLLTEASQLDPADLNRWLDNIPGDQYVSALKVHAHVLAAKSTIAAGATR